MTELQTLQANENIESHGRYTPEIWEHAITQLQRKASLTPRPLTSNMPVIGRAIAWFRNAWNSVSTRWYIAPLVQQQNEFNHGVIDELRAVRSDLHSLRSELGTIVDAQQELRQLLDEISDRLIANDRDVAALTHDLGKVTYAVIRLDKNLKRIDSTLSG